MITLNTEKALCEISEEIIKGGSVPQAFKLDHKQLLPKPPSISYQNKCIASRPITIESLISMLLQRIIGVRLECFLESNSKFQDTQEAYRKDIYWNDSILIRPVHQIQEGWNKNETTILCIIDFKSYFGTI